MNKWRWNDPFVSSPCCRRVNCGRMPCNRHFYAGCVLPGNITRDTKRVANCVLQIVSRCMFKKNHLSLFLLTFRHLTKSVLVILSTPWESNCWQSSIHWSWLFEMKVFTTLSGSLTPDFTFAMIWMSGFTSRTSSRSLSNSSSRYTS